MYVQTCTCLRMHVYIQACMDARTYMHTRIHTLCLHTHTNKHAHTRTRTCIHTCAHICTYMHTCTRTYARVTYTQTYRHASSSLDSRSVPWLGKSLSIPSPSKYLVLSSARSVAPVFDQVVSHSLAGLPCRLFLSQYYGLKMVTHEVHRSSLMRLLCSARNHFIFLTFPVISVTFVLFLTQMLVLLSMTSIRHVEHTYFHFDLFLRKFVLIELRW